MPTTRRRRTRHPMLKDYSAVGVGERLRWLGGGPIVGDFTPIGDVETVAPLTVWESWREWAEVYTRCRLAFLVDFARRFPARVAAAERIYEAFSRGGEAGADAEAAQLAQERAEETRHVYAGLGR